MPIYRRIYELVAKIPRGRVATYGQIAALAGSPRAARQVGWILRQSGNGGLNPPKADATLQTIPWWRVLSSRGMISIENLAVPKEEQARRLQAEGVAVELKSGNFWVDLTKYQMRD